MKDVTLRDRLLGDGGPPLLGVLFCLFCLVLVVSGYIEEGTFQQRAPSILTTGKIIEITATGGGGPAPYTYTLTIRFFTRQRQAIEFTSGDDCDCHVGDVVSVAYHADKPEEAQIVPSGGPWLGNLLSLIVGVITGLILIAGFVLAFYVSTPRLLSRGYRAPRCTRAH